MDENERNHISAEVHLSDGRTTQIQATYHDAADTGDVESITALWYSLDHDELAALIQEAASASGEDDFNAEKAYSDVKAAIERNYQAMLDAGHSEAELAGLSLADLMDGEWIAEQLQGEAGNVPVGAELGKQIKSSTPKRQSVRITKMLTSMTDSQIRRARDKGEVTVNEAAQLAVAYGVTTGELLGIVDADEVKLLKLFRSGSEEQRKALLAVLGPWDEKGAWQCG